MKRIVQGVMLGCLSSGSLFAGMMQDTAPPSPAWQWVGQLSVGTAWSKAGETETFYLNPTIEKSYRASKKLKGMPSGELFLGVQKALSSQIFGQLGLVVATTGNARVDGIIWDDADPQFNNYTYRYKVRNTRIGVKGRALLDKGQKLVPYVSGSVNIGFNRAHDFTNNPLIFQAIPNQNFESHIKTAFSYTLGAGIQTPLNNHWHTGIGYEFLDFGKSNLNRAPGQTMGSGLSLNHLYTHGILVN
ncbi:outer membrane protein, partial [Legionella sp. W05-934-2]|uniref:outer membrane protein n=1 Tax=Legionella sp. W05-934-2 TaxID=1198649 RepID=UPI00346208BD